MKVVFLTAGRGRRLGRLTKNKSKTMIKLGGKPLIGHLVEAFLDHGLSQIVLVVGHAGDEVVKFVRENYQNRIDLQVVVNDKYLTHNNLYSLYLARNCLTDGFITCYGDMVFDKRIIGKILKDSGGGAIACERASNGPVDSPGVRARDGQILDLGRHITYPNADGYAIGLYKFGSDLREAFFEEAEKMLDQGYVEAGFYDPLLKLFGSYPSKFVDIGSLLWTDIDKELDILKAERIWRQIRSES